MRVRLARVGSAILGALALLGLITPPAEATTVGSLAFVGTVTMSGGLAYPCFPGPNLFNCPGPNAVGTSTLPLRHLPDNPHVNITGGNTRSFTLVTALCFNRVANIAKLAKAPAHVGSCGLQMSGLITGWCGLSSGNGIALFTDALGQLYRVTFHFTDIGGTFAITGHVQKLTNPPPNGEGLFVGVAEFSPVPVVGVPTISNSCSAKTAYVFQLAGTADYIFLNTLPPI